MDPKQRIVGYEIRNEQKRVGQRVSDEQRLNSFGYTPGLEICRESTTS